MVTFSRSHDEPDIRYTTAGRREAAGHPAIEACRQALVDASPLS